MSEGRSEGRKPPPGKSFPFLRRGEGQKTKIQYPVLKRSSSGTAHHEAKEDAKRDWRRSEEQEEGSWRTPSAPRTVRTADSGFDQEGELQPIEDETPRSNSPSTSQQDSTPSSSVGHVNIDLRRNQVLPLQQWTTDKDYSFSTSPSVQSPSPVLASTPRQDAMRATSEPPRPPPALETPILGDVTNTGQNEDSDSDETAKEMESNEEQNAPQQQYPRKSALKSGPGITLVPRIQLIQPERRIPVREPAVSKPPLPSLQRTPVNHGQHGGHPKGYTDVERKLVEQLRNAIAHLDLADMEQQIRVRELELAYNKFRGDVREFEAEKEAEKERVQRVRRQLEREKKLLNKDGDERNKVFTEQIDDLTKTITKKDAQISAMRLRLRKAEEQVEQKDKELTESNKKADRLEKFCKTLQRQLAQVRGNSAKQAQEMAAQLQAAQRNNLRKRGTVGLLPTLHRKEPQEDKTNEQETPETQKRADDRSKNVTWADADRTAPACMLSGQTPGPKKGSYKMELVEQGMAYFGPCRLFKNGIGDWTKVTTTECGCSLYEYSNSDVRWLCCDRTVEINYFGIKGATTITHINGGTINYFNTGQVDIYRVSGEISRFDCVTKQRTETMLHPDGTRYVEIFDGSGFYVHLEGTSKDRQRFGERSSYRGYPSDRHVYNHSNTEPEWIEPEYNARVCPDGSLKVKFSNIMVCCLGVEDVGYVKHTTRLQDGSERKRMCVEWGHVARARQREIEAQKCQRLTALNATM
ncbi:hypothetical protein Q1695_014329 [Nippostrongylus brasiliensis]|nr:hypothetical protein Q1695_014329 [Nippostrongylus brasiliensis]